MLKKNFLEVFDAFNADIFAIQETKCQVGQVELDLPGYHQYWSAAEKKGYSGTAVFTREEPLRVLHGLGNEYLDAEGRIVACEFPQFWFVNVYTPNSQMEGFARASITVWNGTMPSAISARGLRPACCPTAPPATRSRW